MDKKYSVKLSRVVERVGLEPVYLPDNYDEITVSESNLMRPGLQLAGFYNYFASERILLIGIMETALIETFDDMRRRECIDRLMSYRIPALVICHGVEILPEYTEAAKKYGVTLLRSDTDTSRVQAALTDALQEFLAPRITRSGVFVEVYGEGLLLLGESGVGKSEAAIELIKRGHRLVADDAVEIRKVDYKRLVGMAPELIRYYIELRGIGVIDVRRIFGSAAVKFSSTIDLVVNIEPWSDDYSYDRLGISEDYTEILGIKVPSITIPVKPGRNLAVILEVAAMNNKQKNMGINSARELTEQIDRYFLEAQNGGNSN